ncbi:M3 family oligoendopeptidase [Vallitalea okinawensis]|uniref:M3 family oligoendopeptidase n=1 Tax=Vallitalea okinawensis TaxID=2078660 RepID=UPI000CFB8519|nr:M3 family oligoendopeptidase [Vallitalea okinawensis]
MNQRWNLKALYQGFDDPNYTDDYNTINQLIEKLNGTLEGFDHSSVNDQLIAYLKQYSSLQSLIEKYSAYARLTLSVESSNQVALNAVERIEALLPSLSGIEVKFQEVLLKIKDIQNVLSNDELNEYSFFITELLRLSRYTLDTQSEKIISEMMNTGSNAWSKLQSQLTSTLLVNIEIDGEEKQLPLPIVRNMAFDSDPTIRKKAYDAELKSYDKVAKSSAACLNAIKGEVISNCKMRGYTSPIEMTLISSRMDQKTLDALMNAIKESLPVFHKYFRKKAELLGHDNGLPFYDLFAPLGSSDLSFSYDEAKKFIVSNFSDFSDKLGAYASNAFESDWIDAEPREGKVGGAFCANLHCIGESRILANFDGSLSNTITLAHELGHGYHGACLKESDIINSSYPMPLAETASIFCETIATNAALKSAAGDDRLRILEDYLQGAAQVIVDIYSRYLFESELFKRREKGSLSVEELCSIMKKAQLQAYGDGLDPNRLHPYMWLNKPHYYYASHNFYNFPYAFGLLFGKGLYAIFEEKGEAFVKAYDQLLTATGRNTIYDVGKMINIDLHDEGFFRNGLKIIEKDIDSFIES